MPTKGTNGVSLRNHQQTSSRPTRATHRFIGILTVQITTGDQRIVRASQPKKSIARLLALVVGTGGAACAQNVTVTLGTTHQTIRGFGGMTHRVWTGYDLNASDRNLAFGNGSGQLGFTVLRVWISDNESQWSLELPTAKDVIARGGIVYATPWNPPASMAETVSRNGRSEKRVKPGSYADYAAHLNKFAKYMKDNGVPLHSISFANEPDWGYDWTWWTVDEVYNFTKNNAGALRANGNKVMSAESFAYAKSYYDKILNDPAALANIDIIGHHYYASSASSANSFFQYPLADQKAPTKERWMTEHYTDSKGSANLWAGWIETQDQGQAVRMDSVRALDVGYEMHRGLVEGKLNVYTWWYIRRDYGPIMNTGGTVSKRGYVMGQFSKFIRPGWVRVEATKNPSTHTWVSAYKKDDSVVVVAINRSGAVNLNVSIPGIKATKLTKYTTSSSKNIANGGEITVTNGSATVPLDASSATTLVYNVANTAVERQARPSGSAAGPGVYEILDLSGTRLGTLNLAEGSTLQAEVAKLTSQRGVFLARSLSGREIRRIQTGF